MGVMFIFFFDEYFLEILEVSEYFVCVYFFVLDVIYIYCILNLYKLNMDFFLNLIKKFVIFMKFIYL